MGNLLNRLIVRAVSLSAEACGVAELFGRFRSGSERRFCLLRLPFGDILEAFCSLMVIPQRKPPLIFQCELPARWCCGKQGNNLRKQFVIVDIRASLFRLHFAKVILSICEQATEHKRRRGTERPVKFVNDGCIDISQCVVLDLFEHSQKSAIDVRRMTVICVQSFGHFNPLSSQNQLDKCHTCRAKTLSTFGT